MPTSQRSIIPAKADGKVVEFRRANDNDGTTYVVVLLLDGKNYALSLDAGGRVISKMPDEDREEPKPVAVDDLPANIKKTFLREAGGAAIKGVEVKQEKKSYSTEIVVGSAVQPAGAHDGEDPRIHRGAEPVGRRDGGGHRVVDGGQTTQPGEAERVVGGVGGRVEDPRRALRDPACRGQVVGAPVELHPDGEDRADRHLEQVAGQHRAQHTAERVPDDGHVVGPDLGHDGREIGSVHAVAPRALGDRAPVTAQVGRHPPGGPAVVEQRAPDRSVGAHPVQEQQ